MNLSNKSVSLFIIALVTNAAFSQVDSNEQPPYQFTLDYSVKSTPVKSQDSTGTCWCFSAVSFLESEMLRTGKREMDLSEMFIVRYLYPQKARNYVRLHGRTVFQQGSLNHDAIRIIKEYGIVPEAAYPGVIAGEQIHQHAEMFEVLKAMLDAVLKNHLTEVWFQAFEAVLNTYLGEPPQRFTYEGRSYSPKEFYDTFVGLNLNDYIELTSFTHHPFYERIRLEIPDNWSMDDNYVNVPIDELERIADEALQSGFSFAWDGDMTEATYATKKTGYAIIPVNSLKKMGITEGKPEISAPALEIEITQGDRQKSFDNLSTTDDHLMHIIGIAHDQKGTKYYVAKDSWDADNINNGLIYLSRSYFRLKTIAIMINRQSLSDDMRKKTGL